MPGTNIKDRHRLSDYVMSGSIEKEDLIEILSRTQTNIPRKELRNLANNHIYMIAYRSRYGCYNARKELTKIVKKIISTQKRKINVKSKNTNRK